ncbi:MAG: hypothetical protein V5A30_00380 [Haloarculaceae archaeon]
MSQPRPPVRTRGGLLVAVVVGLVLWFEARTVAGMFFGVTLPPVPYMLAGLVVVGALAVVADVTRTSHDAGT